MKANEAPKKIYMSPAGVLYKGDKQQCNDIEYTRTDAFIEKALKWLKNNTDITPTGIRNFKKAMKGE